MHDCGQSLRGGLIIRERRSALHRIHKKPSPESVDKLCRLLAELGIVFPQDPSGKDFAEAITAADKKSAALETRCCRSSWERWDALITRRIPHPGTLVWLVGVICTLLRPFAAIPIAYTTRFNCGLGKKRTAHRTIPLPPLESIAPNKK